MFFKIIFIQHSFTYRPLYIDGCWDRTQNCSDFSFDSQTL